MPERSRVWPWYLLAIAVIVVDHLAKWIASQNLDYGQPVPLLPVLDLTLVHNRGAAFSFLSDAGGWQRWFFAVVAVGVSAWIAWWLHHLPAGKRWLAASLALILGGAVGNLADRLVLGYVVDFISVHWGPYYFPAFNIADSAITVGAVMMLIDTFFFDGEEAPTDADQTR
ncbi:MAG: signal peptidase II [Gammaproteobacteria bacterium]